MASGFQWRELKDVAYCQGVDDPLRALDLYVPTELFDGDHSAKEIVLIMFVHGGAWRSGDKSEHRSLARRWVRDCHLPSYAESNLTSSPSTARMPYSAIIALPNYRLSPAIKHPTHAADLRDALAFLLSQPAVAPFSYSKVWLAGHSAGAHIISSLVLSPPILSSIATPRSSSPANAEEPSKKDLISRITGVIGLEGIYNIDLLLESFPSEYYRIFIEQAFGLPMSPTSRPYAQASVTNYARPSDGSADHVLWVIVHSQGDELVDLPQAESMVTHLSKIYNDVDVARSSKAGSPDGKLNAQVMKEFDAVKGGHDGILETGELSDLVRRVIMRS